jgi:hypothetical protein
LPSGEVQLIGAEVHPEIGRHAEVLGKPQGGVRGDVALAREELIEAVRWDLKQLGELLGGETEFFELVREYFAGVDGSALHGCSFRYRLWKVILCKSPPGAVVYPIDDHSPLLAVHMKDDPMGEVEEVSNLRAKLVLLRDDRTAYRRGFERIDRLNESAKPAAYRVGFLFDFADESNVLFGV